MQEFTGLEYLKIDIANNYGNGLDKEIWDKRLAWFDSIERQLDWDLVEHLASDADKPLLFKKAFRAYEDAINSVPTGHMMGLDAVNSGLQVLAAFTGCHDTAKMCGLVDTGERPSAYMTMAKIMNEDFGCNVTGEQVKKPLMVSLYGSKAEPIALFGEDTPELKAFYETMHRLMPGAVEAMDDILGCWQWNDLAHTCVFPDGHEFHVPVLHKVEKKIAITELGGATFTHRASVNMTSNEAENYEATGKYIEKNNRISILANLVQGTDGYIVREMVRMARDQGFALLTIHDDFYASPNFMNQVRKNYREILARITESNLLENLLQQLTKTNGKLTRKSDNLAEKIRESEYCLA